MKSNVGFIRKDPGFWKLKKEAGPESIDSPAIFLATVSISH
jgi:hypothetical protein